MRLLALLAAGLFVGTAVAAPVPKAIKKDEKIDAAKLVGHWQLMKVDGKPPGGTIIREYTANGEMNEVVTLDKLEGSWKGTYKVDGSKLETARKVPLSADVFTSTSEIVKLTDAVLHIKVGDEVDEFERVKDEKKEEKKDK